jgi:hypothetical protein
MLDMLSIRLSILQTAQSPRKILLNLITREARAGREEALILFSLGSRLVEDLLRGSNFSSSDTLELAVVLN